jgi:hypothetical protein
MDTGAPADLLGRLVEAVDALAAEDVTGKSLRIALVTLERARARLDAEVSRRLAEFDRSCEWSVVGSKSAAGFLAGRTRCSRGEAHHRVRLAREVEEMPQVAEVWRAGTVTTRHVEVIAKARHAAKADEQFAAFEASLVSVARAGTPEDVAGTARQWRDALEADLQRDGADCATIAAVQHSRRAVSFARSIEGMGFGEITLDAEGAEVVETALRLAYERLHLAGDPRTPLQQRADALVEICRTFADCQPGRANLPNILVVHDVDTLRGDAVGQCRLGSGHRISPETARRLACDAFVQDVLTGSDGVPLAMGRATRTYTPDQFRALVLRDGHCRGPDCRVEARHCEAHHLARWERDHGPTDLDNGALFCRGHHHRMLHEGQWTVRGNPNGRLDFYDRAGKHIGASAPVGVSEAILTQRGRERDVVRARVADLVSDTPPREYAA